MRSLTWVSDKNLTGWTCSACDWTFPLPSLLGDPEAKKAYDRLASAKFQRHDCATHQPVGSLDPEGFTARAIACPASQRLCADAIKPVGNDGTGCLVLLSKCSL